MEKYTKRPVTISAIQHKAGVEDYALAQYVIEGILEYKEDGTVLIKTLEGIMCARPGDWIIRGINGEIYPCKPDIFEKSYIKAKDIDENK